MEVRRGVQWAGRPTVRPMVVCPADSSGHKTDTQASRPLRPRPLRSLMLAPCGACGHFRTSADRADRHQYLNSSAFERNERDVRRVCSVAVFAGDGDSWATGGNKNAGA